MASHSNFEFKMGVTKFCSFLVLVDPALYFCCLHVCLLLLVCLLFCFGVAHSDSNVHIIF